jgi:hypothetical protein
MAAMVKKDIKMNKATRERIARLPIGTKVEVTCGNIAYVGMKGVVVGDDGNGFVRFQTELVLPAVLLRPIAV